MIGIEYGATNTHARTHPSTPFINEETVVSISDGSPWKH